MCVACDGLATCPGCILWIWICECIQIQVIFRCILHFWKLFFLPHVLSSVNNKSRYTKQIIQCCHATKRHNWQWGHAFTFLHQRVYKIKHLTSLSKGGKKMFAVLCVSIVCVCIRIHVAQPLCMQTCVVIFCSSWTAVYLHSRLNRFSRFKSATSSNLRSSNIL